MRGAKTKIFTLTFDFGGKIHETKLNARQLELLDVAINNPGIANGHAAFLIQTTPQGAGRIMKTLTRQNLAFYDVNYSGVEGQYEFWATDKGRALAAQNFEAFREMYRRTGIPEEEIKEMERGWQHR